MNEIGIRKKTKQKQRINENESRFMEKIKVESLAKQDQKLEVKKKDTIDSIEIHRTIRDYYEKLYAN